MLGAVGIRALVEKYRIVLKRCKSMRKTGRYPQHFFVFTTEFNAVVLSVRWGSFSDVHGYVQHAAFLNTYQLPLCFWRRLKMQAAYNPSPEKLSLSCTKSAEIPARSK